MPSVFFISLMSGAPWGGSEELWFRTALHASENGWKVACAVYHWPQKEARINILKKNGVDIYYIPNKGKSKRNLAEIIQNKLSKWKAGAVIENLPVNNYDVVVVNQGAFETLTPAWRFFYRKLGKYVLLFHNYKEDEFLNASKSRILQSWINGSSKNLFAANRIREVIKKNSGIESKHSDILYNPISFDPPGTHVPLPAYETFHFAMLAALDVKRKAQDKLVMALSSERWKKRNWKLHLYGEGEDRKLIHNLISENNLSERIILEGHTTHVKKVLEDSHLLLQITHMDAMPLSVVEAMAIGRPVVVSKIGDMPVWVTHGQNGWISENASVEKIDSALEIAWENRGHWGEMGKRSFEIFCEKFPGSVEERLLRQIGEIL